MSGTAYTGTAFYLDPVTWDLVLSPTGFVLAKGNYATLQNVACAVRTFVNELWYDTSRGIPYFTVLGVQPPSSFLKARIETIAKTVPNVANAKCVFTNFDITRRLRGQVQVALLDGTIQTVNFQ